MRTNSTNIINTGVFFLTFIFKNSPLKCGTLTLHAPLLTKGIWFRVDSDGLGPHPGTARRSHSPDTARLRGSAEMLNGAWRSSRQNQVPFPLIHSVIALADIFRVC